MKKVNKYTISFGSIEAKMSTEIQISRAEFNKQLSFLRKQIEATADEEYPMEERFREDTTEALIARTYTFTVGTGDTYLTHYECKPGYCFK